jgi:uncharacterized protein YecE (DUF72 family)
MKVQPVARVYVGCAGWNIPKTYASWFPPGESHLARYAARLPAVEINSSFYKLHQETTYARWAAAVPERFRFAVKLSRQVTHIGRLADLAGLDNILMGPRALGTKLGPLLVQLPPSLVYQGKIAAGFFAALRERFDGQVACEPRHQSWFTPEANELLAGFRVARVAADPAPAPEGAMPGGWSGLVYYRLHGSPQIYYSAYPQEFLDSLAIKLSMASHSAPVWCIFDNTARGAAMENVLAVLAQLHDQ